MSTKAGIREVKAKFSHFLNLARAGEDVVVTQRGEPVVRLVGVRPASVRSEDEVLADLALAGLVEPGVGVPKKTRPVKPRSGPSISQAVREMRR